VAEPVRVKGLNEFRRSLKQLDKDAPKALRVAFNSAAELIVSEATPRIPRRTGRAQGSVKVRSTQTAARIVGGSKRVPYYPWLDFGGSVGRKKTVTRRFLKHGRYIYDSYFRNRDKFRDNLSDELNQVVKQAGLGVD